MNQDTIALALYLMGSNCISLWYGLRAVWIFQRFTMKPQVTKIEKTFTIPGEGTHYELNSAWWMHQFLVNFWASQVGFLLLLEAYNRYLRNDALDITTLFFFILGMFGAFGTLEKLFFKTFKASQGIVKDITDVILGLFPKIGKN